MVNNNSYLPWQTGKLSFHPMSEQSSEGEPIKVKFDSQDEVATAPLNEKVTEPCIIRPKDEQLVPVKRF